MLDVTWSIVYLLVLFAVFAVTLRYGVRVLRRPWSKVESIGKPFLVLIAVAVAVFWPFGVSAIPFVLLWMLARWSMREKSRLPKEPLPVDRTQEALDYAAQAEELGLHGPANVWRQVTEQHKRGRRPG